MGTKLDSGIPSAAIQSGSGSRGCPECDHEPTAPGAIDRLAGSLLRRAGFRTRPRCHYWESSAESDVGLPGECGCRHRFHGP